MAAAWYRRNATFSAGSRGRRANHPIGFAPLRAGDAGGEHIARLTALLFERLGHGVHELAVIVRARKEDRAVRCHLAPRRRLALAPGQPLLTFSSPGIGAEFLAHREKSKLRAMTRHVRLSPVPMGRAHRPTRAVFAVIPGECLKPETWWRREADLNSQYPPARLGAKFLTHLRRALAEILGGRDTVVPRSLIARTLLLRTYIHDRDWQSHISGEDA